MNAGGYVTGTQLRKLGDIMRRQSNNYGLILMYCSDPLIKESRSVLLQLWQSELYGKDVRYCSNRKEEKDHGDTGILLEVN